MNALYTDINIECCAWLGSRVEDGSLPPGDVLLADVRDLRAEHLDGYDAVHLFADIGGFPLGLAWAGWPVGVRVLTGGFPCQDISAAGKGAGLGTADEPTTRRPIRVQPAPRSETEAFTVRSYPRVAEMLGIPQAKAEYQQ